MRKAELLTGISLIIVFAVSFTFVHKDEEDNRKARKLYNQYCANCHGMKMDRFAGREWVFGSSKEEMFSTIKNGRPSIGMPGFDKAMSHEEIKLMAGFIITELPHMIKEIDKSRLSEDGIFNTDSFSFKLQEVVGGLNIPWGMAFLPNGSMLVTDKTGQLYVVENNKKIEIEGVPKVMLQGQGGLLDVAVHPNFAKNNLIYLAYSEGNNSEGGNTTVARAVLQNNKLVKFEKLLHALPNVNSGIHFGCRMVFDKDNYLFVSFGERGIKPNAQNLNNHGGKIHRIFDDGRIPADNPFYGKKDAIGSIWSYGHRNPQSLYYEKETGILWENEHGPKGGDELNIIEKGKNYGWPLITYGIDYDGTIISSDTAKPGLQQPVFYWIPSIAPCGMTMVTSDKYKGWKKDFLTGALAPMYLERLKMKNRKVVGREKLLVNIGRVRNVIQGPDGYIYFSVEKPGRVFKIVPLQ